MYYAIVRGEKVPVGERPCWVKPQSNGVTILCPENEGRGVVINGEIYHVRGREMFNAPTVDLFWEDDILYLKKASEFQIGLRDNELWDEDDPEAGQNDSTTNDANILIRSAREARKQVLIINERLDRTSNEDNSTVYTPGEQWRGGRLYFEGDKVKDDRGKCYKAEKRCLNKSPVNNPNFWMVTKEE